MPDDGKLKVKDTVPHVEKKTTVNVQKVSSPPATTTTTKPQGQGGVTKAQWTVIGLLIILLVLELVIHPNFQAAVLTFLRAFKPSTNSTPANTPAVSSNFDIGTNQPVKVTDIGTDNATSNVPVGGQSVGSF